MTGQSRKHGSFEAVANVAVGYLLFTVVSLARPYAPRRLVNRWRTA